MFPDKNDTIIQVLEKRGVTRRDFLKMSVMLAGTLGLNYSLIGKVVQALETKSRVPVIWLEFQDCAGCTESITRSQNPTLTQLVLNDIALDYHETLMVAAGFQAESAKDSAMEKYKGEYVLVVEGSIPLANPGYCTVAGKAPEDVLRNAADGAAAIIAVGNCATFGGLPKAKPNPTDAFAVMDVLTDKTVINLPGCPAIPEVMTNTIAYLLVEGKAPELDALNRPMMFYAQTLHDRCLRRGFYDAGLYAKSFNDEGYRKGYCLYKLGCKGPTTYNSCASLKWNQGTSWPVQSGHPCLGCSQPNFWDGGGFYEGQGAILQKPGLAALGGAALAGLVIGGGVSVANSREKERAKQTPEQSTSHEEKEE